AGALEAAERRVHEIAGGRAVDLYGARLNVVHETVCIDRAGGRNGGREAVLGVVGHGDRLFVAAHLDDGQHRAEDFFARDTHRRGHIGEHGGCQVEAVVEVSAGQAFAADQVGGFALADRHVLKHGIHL